MEPVKESQEPAANGYTTLVFGDRWKVNVYKIKNETQGFQFGFRRYHRHDNDWFAVYKEAWAWADDHNWRCSLCDVNPPAELEGYVKLAIWAGGDDDN